MIELFSKKKAVAQRLATLTNKVEIFPLNINQRKASMNRHIAFFPLFNFPCHLPLV